ncbi:MAG TPA: alpha/beta hydrolase-fold protein, partial [Candidatus Dormibacteraeota bacterium]|nr:alpha/beta hydrolase-fold protein [Candidatus Dormibacteraeota bacterium]
ALITGLVVDAAAGAVAAFATGRLPPGTLAGVLALIAMFGPTFVQETTAALGSSGPEGSFDPTGWALTLATLVIGGLAVGFAAAAVALAVRPAVLAALEPIGALLRRRDGRVSELRRPALLAVVIVVLTIAASTFGDLVNFAPDSLMRRGGPPPVSLAEGAAAASAPLSSAGPGESTSSATALDPSGSPPPAPATPTPTPSGSPPPAETPTPTARPMRRPWLAWRPSGSGRIVFDQLPAPWSGGATTEVAVYLPPGYDSSPARRYPVLYEAPTPYNYWDGATNAKTVLDSLIDSGVIPSSVVVFISTGSGPYPDTECSDSFDGREWTDRYIAHTVVAWVDAWVRTIAAPAGRAIFGMSQGGYCAAILALHHPDVFATEISFSGYYEAGVAAPSAAAVFGGIPSLLAADSPISVAPHLAAGLRARTEFVLVADAAQSFYGPQQSAFLSVLRRAGYPTAPIWTPVPHGWQQVRAEFAPALEEVAQHEVALGVFG